MRIAYDHQIFVWQKYGGISRYFYEIATRIPSLSAHEVQIVAPLFVNQYLRDNPEVNVIGCYVPYVPKAGRILRGLTSGPASWLLHRIRPDVVHETYYYAKKLAPRRARTVITVHDMIHERFPDHFHFLDPTSREKRAAAHRADHIICVSENTRRDLIELFGVEVARTSVVSHGYSLTVDPTTVSPPPIERSYIAYVGQRGGYKNFKGLLDAYRSSKLLRENFAIVCFGGGRLGASELEAITERGIQRDSVIQIQGDDRLLAGVYRHAAAFVYPSWYEGFGVPPLEAMALGCPVACSDTSSLPEVCGEAAEYFDPHDPQTIRASLERVVESSSRRDQLVRAGYKRIRLFSWERCAQQTVEVYASLV